MSASAVEDHGPGLRVAQSDVGSVTVCPCGVVTLTMQYLSLRLEPEAFRSLSQMLSQAQARLERSAVGPAHTALSSEPDDAAPAAPTPRHVH